MKVICRSNMPFLSGEGFVTDKPMSVSLTVGRVYQAEPGEHGWLRVWDNTEEDYLFPAGMFEVVED
jgi:hypothetical protein